jgi:hypothetical protein
MYEKSIAAVMSTIFTLVALTASTLRNTQASVSINFAVADVLTRPRIPHPQSQLIDETMGRVAFKVLRDEDAAKIPVRRIHVADEATKQRVPQIRLVDEATKQRVPQIRLVDEATKQRVPQVQLADEATKQRVPQGHITDDALYLLVPKFA